MKCIEDIVTTMPKLPLSFSSIVVNEAITRKQKQSQIFITFLFPTYKDF